MTTKEAITTPDDPDLGAINQMHPVRTTITLYPFGENYGHTVLLHLGCIYYKHSIFLLPEFHPLMTDFHQCLHLDHCLWIYIDQKDQG